MKKKTLMRRISVAELSLAAVLALYLWTAAAEQEAHVIPDYPKENIASYANRKMLTDEEYELLFRQTGLGRPAIDMLCSTGRQEELFALQENYFAEVQVQCAPNTLVSRAEYLVKPQQVKKQAAERQVAEQQADTIGQRIPVIEEGDILVNFNCHVFGWRSGHAGIVTDAEKRLTLEAKVLGTDTELLSLERWEQSPTFVVLRLKNASKEERAEIAAYAEEHLTDIPYSLTAGLWSSTGLRDSLKHGCSKLWNRMQESAPKLCAGLQELFPELEKLAVENVQKSSENPLQGTHCAHLVWYAYKQFGYDLDSDGGRIVTPRDLYESPMLEIVQIYGMELPKF